MGEENTKEPVEAPVVQIKAKDVKKNDKVSVSEARMSEDELKAAELEWVQLNQTLSKLKKMDGEGVQETQKEKLTRKVMENPFIPIGSLATAGCLMMGLGKFARNDMAGSQTMMRGRIAAQGFTVIAVILGLGLSANKQMQKHYKGE